LFAENWIKKFDLSGRKFYRDKETGQTQEVKPSSETYLIQAAMLGNINFLNLYLKARGSLSITDKRGRTALHHSVANGHQ
jgi:ankyrin repeat protein